MPCSSASSVARRRDGNYSVAPPPEGEKPLPHENALLPPDSQLRLASPVEKTPSLLPISAPIDEPGLSQASVGPTKGKKRQGCWLYVLLLISSLVLVALIIGRYDPGMPARAYSLYWPTLSVFLPESAKAIGLSIPVSGTPTPTPTHVQPSPTATLPLILASEASPDLNLSRTPEPTIIPTLTPTPWPTPMGGGIGEITFVSNLSGNYQVYTMNLDGSGRRQITRYPGRRLPARLVARWHAPGVCLAVRLDHRLLPGIGDVYRQCGWRRLAAIAHHAGWRLRSKVVARR